MPSILIGADICPIEGNRRYFMDGDANRLFNDLLPELKAADLVIANLECPLIQAPSPIPKTGPIFGEPGECIRGIQAAGIDVLCLANNHILDHGPEGLRNTLEVCERAGVATVGAGHDLESAGRVLARDLDGIRVGIFAVAEREFSVASVDRSGANPLDVIAFVRMMQRERGKFDVFIVLFHGAAEFQAPTPRVQELCRFMVEMGASAVVVQHPHVLGGFETHQGGHIFYGQGALIMDEAIYRDRKTFHDAYLIRLDLAPKGQVNFSIIPFVQSTPAPGARRLVGVAESKFRKCLEERAKAILNPAFVAAEWTRFCEESRHSYFSAMLGHSRVFRKLNYRGWLTRLLYPKRALLGTQNVVRCETHREAIETLFARTP